MSKYAKHREKERQLSIPNLKEFSRCKFFLLLINHYLYSWKHKTIPRFRLQNARMRPIEDDFVSLNEFFVILRVIIWNWHWDCIPPFGWICYSFSPIQFYQFKRSGFYRFESSHWESFDWMNLMSYPCELKVKDLKI